MDNLSCLVDLHLHLDGAISFSSARTLAALQGIDIPDSDEELKKLIKVSPDCKNLNEFLEKFEFPCSLLKTHNGVETAVKNLLNELSEQGVMYAEIRFAPQLCVTGDFTQRDAVIAALAGLDNSPVNCNLILCCMRGVNLVKENMETVDVAAEFLGKGVCAVDLAGAEALYPTSDFADVFDYATKKGVPFTIHAGEASGARSVWDAISFGARRIGHGIRSVEDEELINKLAENKIPLELCPTSNICTCVYDNILQYPLRKLIDSGVVVTINTDDPAIEGTDIKTEYKKLIDCFSLTGKEIKKLLENSVNSSFASDELKKSMLAEIEEQLYYADY